MGIKGREDCHLHKALHESVAPARLKLPQATTLG